MGVHHLYPYRFSHRAPHSAAWLEEATCECPSDHAIAARRRLRYAQRPSHQPRTPIHRERVPCAASAAAHHTAAHMACCHSPPMAHGSCQPLRNHTWSSQLGASPAPCWPHSFPNPAASDAARQFTRTGTYGMVILTSAILMTSVTLMPSRLPSHCRHHRCRPRPPTLSMRRPPTPPPRHTCTQLAISTAGRR